MEVVTEEVAVEVNIVYNECILLSNNNLFFNQDEDLEEEDMVMVIENIGVKHRTQC